MANTCNDCLFRGGQYKWDNQDYCNKVGHVVEDDQPACGNFLPDNHNCCYDCDYYKDLGIASKCTYHKKTIKNPGNWYCYNFTY
ncbi:hypothetical protein [Ruminococcus sp. HUN007]|uniref:hypothetical protein n=1 Tax=Ruminococcus sp. HUN007 TaxID=1514668 RepID=UPI0005D2B7E3|nr:hypothetical protein [Ruminococcus sp. HUN007]